VLLLRIGALLAAERRVGQDHIELPRRLLVQGAVSRLAGQGIAVPEVRLIDAMQHQVGQRNGED
jgi:hypothetical protein